MTSESKPFKANYLITNLSTDVASAFLSLPGFIVVFNFLVFYEDFMLLERVFQRIPPLIDRNLCPHLDVLTFGTCSKVFILISYLISVAANNFDKTVPIMSFYNHVFSEVVKEF